MHFYRQVLSALLSLITKTGFQYLVAWVIIKYLGGDALADFRTWFAASALLWIAAGLGVDTASYRFLSALNVRVSLLPTVLTMAVTKLIAIAVFAPIILGVLGIENWQSAVLLAALTSIRTFFTEAVLPAMKKNELALFALVFSFMPASMAAVVGCSKGADVSWMVLVMIASEFMAALFSIILWLRVGTLRTTEESYIKRDGVMKEAFALGYLGFAMKSWVISFFSLATYRYWELIVVNASSPIVSSDYALAQLISSGISILNPALVGKAMLQPYITNRNLINVISLVGGLSLGYVVLAYCLVNWMLLRDFLIFSSPDGERILLIMLAAVFLQTFIATLSLYLMHYRVVSIAIVGNVLFFMGFLCGPLILQTYGLLFYSAIPTAILSAISIIYFLFIRKHYACVRPPEQND